MITQADLVIDTGGTRAETSLQVITAWVQRQLPLPAPLIRRGTPDDADGIRIVLDSVVGEDGQTVLERRRTVMPKRALLRHLPPRSWLTVAQVGNAVAGFQVIAPYAHPARAVDHVATLESYVLAALRGQDLDQAMSRATFEAARALGFRKLVIHVRADDPGAQRFYERLGFRPCGRLMEQALVDGRYVDELLYELFL
ncbi:MAG: GNAT family N-acetyltransferase [Anaerolineae bacterium]